MQFEFCDLSIEYVLVFSRQKHFARVAQIVTRRLRYLRIEGSDPP